MGTPGNSWRGCAWPYFRPKNDIFHTCFQTRPLKSIPVFRPDLLAEIMSSLLRLERKQKISSNAFRIRLFPLCYYSFGIEMINTFIHSRSSLENYTRCHTKMEKSIPVFRPNTLPFVAAQIYMAYIREYHHTCSTLSPPLYHFHVFLPTKLVSVVALALCLLSKLM